LEDEANSKVMRLHAHLENVPVGSSVNQWVAIGFLSWVVVVMVVAAGDLSITSKGCQ